MKKTAKKEDPTKWTHAGMTIRLTPAGTYQLDVMRNGKRTRKNFESLDAAVKHIDNQHAERDRLGVLAVKLTPRQIEDAADAYHELVQADLAASLVEAAQFYVKHHKPAAGGWTVQTAFDKYMQELENPTDGTPARERTIRDKRSRLSSFATIYGATPIEQITGQSVSDWLDATEAIGRNLTNYKTQVQSLFNFCERNAPGDFKNTIAVFPQRKKKETPPAETITITEARRVLAELESIDSKSALTMALGLFAGLRTSEITEKNGLQWTDIDMQERKILVPASQAKTRVSRVVDISDNLHAWLAKYHQTEGRIAWRFNAFKRHRQAACQAAVVQWPSNGARHTFATNHAALHGLRATADQLGHRGGVAMLEDHYRGVMVRKADAQKFFQIMPAGTESKTIQFKQEASA